MQCIQSGCLLMVDLEWRGQSHTFSEPRTVNHTYVLLKMQKQNSLCNKIDTFHKMQPVRVCAIFFFKN